jgi:hypothetical protein
MAMQLTFDKCWEKGMTWHRQVNQGGSSMPGVLLGQLSLPIVCTLLLVLAWGR